jgi:hypothetical protein
MITSINTPTKAHEHARGARGQCEARSEQQPPSSGQNAQARASSACLVRTIPVHEVNGETLINPTATAGKHQAAVKAHLDDLIGVWKDMEENRNSVQDKMMERYDKNYRELKGMKK